MRAACVVAVLIAIATSAAAEVPRPPADRRRIVGILDVRVEGVPKEIAEKFQANLEDQLDSQAYWIAPMSRMNAMMEGSTTWTHGCIVGSCLNEVRTMTGADLVLLAALTGSGTSFGYVVTLVRTDTGRMLAQESERCDVCTVNEALTGATLAAVKLLIAVPEKLPDEAAERQAALDVATAKVRDEKTAQHKHHKTTATIMTLAGVAVAAVGATLYFTQDHADYGLATAAGGAGLAVGGVIALTF
jgi:hypothetical protein